MPSYQHPLCSDNNFLTFYVAPFTPPLPVFKCGNITAKYTAILRKVVGKYVHATIPKGNMGYDQYTVPGFVAVEPTFVAFL